MIRSEPMLYNPWLDRLWPVPREVQMFPGVLRLFRRSIRIDGETTSAAAESLAKRLGLAGRSGAVSLRLQLDTSPDFASGLGPEQRPEAYRLQISESGIALTAIEPEGLLRAAATLLQLVEIDGADLILPRCTLTDFPAFRYRCASDWLLNVEINRWAYDWGDGPEAFRARIERKLDLCFDHKINQVWFDGCGWDVERFPGYADLMRHFTSYARKRGIRLTFTGYGGGYGTSYQQSELYRSGYQGQVYVNRRPYPEGKEYLCCGLPEMPESRRYGSCLSNEALQDAKLTEMARFVEAVRPGFMYIHDIDAGTFAEGHRAWLLRCDECRRRWPSDEMTDEHGQAGAVAAWFRRVRVRLSRVPGAEDYNPARDLTVIFVSPVYTGRHEPGQPEVWAREIEYFSLLSDLIGPLEGIEFGVREQFRGPDGERRIRQLRHALDRAGNGHGIHVISFAGGDNYINDDLTNMSCALVSLFEGAESVCLSNGGVHEEPVQLLNADALWNGKASVCVSNPPDAVSADALYEAVVRGEHRPDAVFAEGGALHLAACRLWGKAAGTHMFRAYSLGGPEGPVSRVWWTITREVRRLRGDPVENGWTWESLRERWKRRIVATEAALEHVRAALRLAPHPDIRWLAQCLEVGRRFAEIVLLYVELRIHDSIGVRRGILAALDELEAYMDREFDLDATDILGGDPGCWRETLTMLRDIARLAGKEPGHR